MSYGFHYVAKPNGWYVGAELMGPGVGATDITSEVMADPPVTSEWGMPGAGPLHLVASSGQLAYTLSNAATVNHGGVLGYYSPENANVREGFRLGILVGLSAWFNGTPYLRGVGWLDTIDPQPGQYLERRVSCVALDYMNELAQLQLTGVPTQVGKRADEIAETILAAVDRQPLAVDLQEGDSTFEYALDAAQAEASTALTELQRLAQSEYGLFFVKGDGTLTFRRRTSLVQIEVLASLNDDMVSMSAPQARRSVLNRIRAITHPRRVDGAPTTILFSNQDKPSIANGESLTITGFYNDPTLRASRVGGTDMVTPVANTDYTANTSEDGSGSDLTSGFSVVATFGANSVDFVITNNSGSAGFLTLLQVRGRGLYDYDPVEVVLSDTDSIGLYGERSLPLDMTYQSDTNTAEAVAAFLLAAWKDPAASSVELSFVCNTDATLLRALTLDVGDGIAVMETVTGVAATFRIQQVRLRIEPRQVVWCTWLLQRVRAEDYWTLGVAGLSELGETTVVGPL